ncbi:MAG: hypothetical protein EBR82_18045 [Caulobacteraceae bacterium]|nr:hypothetical protein [Caulobacteraceae bacterium]
MTASKGTPSLAEFADSVIDSRKKRWADTLPAEVQQQLLDIDCSTAVAVAWLKSLGHTDATTSKVDTWRRARRDERRRQPG